MKKRSVLLVIGIILLSVLVTGCSKRTPITQEEFTKVMEKHGYKIVETRLLSDYEDANNIISAEIEDNNYIELFDMKTMEDAEEFYTLNENYYEKQAKSYTVKNIGSYQKFTGTIDGNYVVFARIEHTIIYSEVNPKHKDTVNKVVKELGY